MASLPGLKLSKQGVNQTLDLEEILGVSFKGNRSLRLQIAQAVIDHIKDRTQVDGKDVNGKKFAPYSKSYKESTVFNLLKAGGGVDMTLTGQMMGDVDVLGDGPSTVQIGFRDQTEILKAYNHNVGDTMPHKREFFGVTAKEVKAIVDKDFKSDINKLQGKPDNRKTVADILGSQDTIANLFQRLLGNDTGRNVDGDV